MRRIAITLLLLGTLNSSVLHAEAVSLASAWQAARQKDPTLQAAIAEREAGQAERAIGRAGLLPQVHGTLGRTRIRGDLDTPDSQGNMVRQDLSYTAKINDISIQQPVFDWDKITAYRQGHAKADHALAVFDTQSTEASERLIHRYFQVLLTQQNVELAVNHLDAAEKNIRIAQRHFDLGEGTITAVHEAQSRRDIARARWLVAKDNVIVARRELQEMIGTDPQQVYPLRAELEPIAIEPAALDDWMALALQRNAQIRAATQDYRVNSLEIQRAFSGHLPSLALTAGWRKTEGETISSRSEKNSTRSFGYQISVPIFSGGETHARVQQAQHQRDRSQHLIEAAREDIAVEVTRQYQGVISGAEHIRALQRAVASSQLAVTAAERGYQGGTHGIRDILDAQERLYQAQLDLTQARLEYVMARLKLAAVVDGLDGELIERTTQLFFSDQPIAL